MRAFVGGVVLLMGPLLALAQTPREQVYKHVPEKATIVAVIPNAAKLVEGVAAFGKAIGVDEMGALTIEEMLEEFDMPGGAQVDSAGPFIIAGVVGDDDEPVVICTVKDAEKWKTEAAVKAGEGGALTSEDGEFHFALDGNVLMMSPKADMLKLAVTGGGNIAAKLGEKLAVTLDGSNALLWIDVASMEKEIRAGLTEFESSLAEGMGAAGPQGAGMALMAKWGVSKMQTLAAETQSVVLLARIGGEGAHLTKHVTMKSESDAAAYLKKMKKSDKDLFRGTIDDRPAFSFGAEWTLPSDTPSLSKMFLEAMVESVKPADPAAADELKAKATRAIAMFDKVSGLAASVTAADGGKMVASSVYFTDDPKAVLDSLAAYQEVNYLITAGLMPGAKLEIKPSQEDIGGTPASLYEMTMTADDPSVSAMIDMMYGTPMLMAAVARDPGVVIAVGSATNAKAYLAKLLSGTPLSGNPQVKTAMGTIPAGPHMCALIDLPRFGQMALGMAGGMGLPLPPLKFPETPTPLIAMGAYVDGAVLSGELHVPSAAIKPIVDTVKAAFSPPKEDTQ